MPLDPEEFRALMRQVCAGDQAAARVVVERYGDAIMRVIRRRLPDQLRSKFDSQDFSQAVWASFFAMPQDQAAFSHPDELARFLVRLARNKVIDAVRQRTQTDRYNVNRERSLEGSVTPKQGEPAARQPTASQVAMAREEMARLQDGQADPHAIARSRQEGRSAEEIARELNVSLRTVYRVLARLKRAKGLS